MKSLACSFYPVRAFHLLVIALAGAFVPSVRADLFALHVYESDQQLALRTDKTEAGAAYWRAFGEFGEKLKTAGILRGGGAFETGNAVEVVRLRAGKAATASGPHTASRESLGGYFIIEVSTRADALRWAAQVPSAATGAVEVRPLYAVPGMP
jgi:hypothetical protein